MSWAQYGAMRSGFLKQILAGVFGLACLACVLGIGFVLFDAAASVSGSMVSGFGIVAVYIMTLGMVGRFLWGKRQTER